jgi:hypothetical protein
MTQNATHGGRGMQYRSRMLCSLMHLSDRAMRHRVGTGIPDLDRPPAFGYTFTSHVELFQPTHRVIHILVVSVEPR